MTTLEEVAESVKALRAENTSEHTEIIKEAKEANGRVKALELWKARMEGVASQWWILAGVVGAALGAGVTRLLS